MLRIIAILALLGALGAAHYHYQGVAVDEAIELTTGRLNREWQDKQDKAIAKKDKAQQDLSNSHFEEVKIKDAKLKSVNNQLGIALNSLSKRTTRSAPSPVTPSNPEAPASCTGAQLFREDAEFLTGEAARSDSIVIERDYYYNEYKSLQDILEQLRK